MVGRVMRQPDARLTERELLNQCYVYCQETDVNDAVQNVKNGLEQEGMGDLGEDVHTSQTTKFKTVPVQRRKKFKGKDIFLPMVLHRSVDGGWEELDYQRHILPGINLKAIGPPDLQNAEKVHPSEISATVDLEEDRPIDTNYNSQELHVDESVRISWYGRRLSDVLPNPFQAARISEEMVHQMYEAGQDDRAIYRQRSSLASQLRDHVTTAMNQQAEDVFRAKLEEGDIRFDLTTSDHNYRVRESFKILVADSDGGLQRFGQPIQFTLFEPVFDRDFNNLERRFAFYLDEQRALQWWYRVAVRQHGEYYLRGWRKERIWPDFVAMCGETEEKPSVLVFETKGDHLASNDDSVYKSRVFAALEETFNVGMMSIHDGPARGAFRLVFDKEGFPDAESAFEKLDCA